MYNKFTSDVSYKRLHDGEQVYAVIIKLRQMHEIRWKEQITAANVKFSNVYKISELWTIMKGDANERLWLPSFSLWVAKTLSILYGAIWLSYHSVNGTFFVRISGDSGPITVNIERTTLPERNTYFISALFNEQGATPFNVVYQHFGILPVVHLDLMTDTVCLYSVHLVA